MEVGKAATSLHLPGCQAARLSFFNSNGFNSLLFIQEVTV